MRRKNTTLRLRKRHSVILVRSKSVGHGGTHAALTLTFSAKHQRYCMMQCTVGEPLSVTLLRYRCLRTLHSRE